MSEPEPPESVMEWQHRRILSSFTPGTSQMLWIVHGKAVDAQMRLQISQKMRVDMDIVYCI